MQPDSKIGAKALASEVKRQRRERRKNDAVAKQSRPDLKLESPAKLPP